MTKKKLGNERLDVNILVPFVGSMAEQIKRIARANAIPNTVAVRKVIEVGLEAIANGKKLEWVVPEEGSLK